MARTHLIGMLLGVEEDWPAAFESLLARANLSVRHGGETHRFTTERVTIEPFDLRAVPRHSLVVDRLAWWYHFPREWLKKVALMDHVHLLNNPFTFQSMVMHFHPDLPMHDRYSVDHAFLNARAGEEVFSIIRIVNAFFRWELNSCETLVRGDAVIPIDYANATPDLAITSLHYYFPWAIRTLLKWVVFCCCTGRRQTVDLDTRRYFAIADRKDITYLQRLGEYRRLADRQLDVERYHD